MTPLDHEFEVPLRRDEGKGAWTIAVLPGSGALLGTRRPVKVSGLMDGHRFDATLLPMGDGTHMVPVRAALRALVDKGDGDVVRIRLDRKH
ncbi:DUF1905 domain-containing protein [Actinokineospora guangxiensis]|uniref:DUF1905 domain-containing protein n=1 Tax=Actinokineospora guangxiensis TaxID=1490288 RepID=A0ABW0ELS9_9PSEU